MRQPASAFAAGVELPPSVTATAVRASASRATHTTLLAPPVLALLLIFLSLSSAWLRTNRCREERGFVALAQLTDDADWCIGVRLEQQRARAESRHEHLELHRCACAEIHCICGAGRVRAVGNDASRQTRDARAKRRNGRDQARSGEQEVHVPRR